MAAGVASPAATWVTPRWASAFYIREPNSACGRLAKQALEGNPVVVGKLGDIASSPGPSGSAPVKEHITKMQRRRWRLALGLGVVLLTLLAVVWAITADWRDTCEHTIITRVPSPDGAWEARVDEDVCMFGLGGGAVIAGVQLVSTRDPARSADLLGVQTGGHEDERPRIAWTAPDILQVTIPNFLYLKVLMRQFDGVRVELRFDPDDPAERAAWLREHGRSPDFKD